MRDKEFSFSAGSSEISPDFLKRLREETVPRLIMLSREYGAEVVEVIGHTDGTSMRDSSRIKGNLDDALGPYLNAATPTPIFAYDNVGLGIARAASVARALRMAGLPVNLHIHPLSAAYLLSPTDRYDPARPKIDDAARRRIDIRIRRFNAN
ncbi:MAG TPA: hypothetical protein VNR39_06650 [Pseudolabrys sp.]|nr:hypothetical protein [Pseudolabrys sp.]